MFTEMLRKAKISDAKRIYELLNIYARKGVLLPRSLNSIYENIRDFWVFEEKEKIWGCCALHVLWEDLAEVRSLAVSPDRRGEGIGYELVRACLLEAWELGVKRVFSLTYVKDFFVENFGFKEVDKSILPHKVWGECVHCVKFPNCDEEAVMLELSEEVIARIRNREKMKVSL